MARAWDSVAGWPADINVARVGGLMRRRKLRNTSLEAGELDHQAHQSPARRRGPLAARRSGDLSAFGADLPAR